MILFDLTIEWRQLFMDTIGKSARFIVFFVGDKIITTLKCWYVSKQVCSPSLELVSFQLAKEYTYSWDMGIV